MATWLDSPKLAAQRGPGQPHVPVSAGPVDRVPRPQASDLLPAPAGDRNGGAGILIQLSAVPRVTAGRTGADGMARRSPTGLSQASGPSPAPPASSAPIVKLLRRRPAYHGDDAA